jgi:hypothetical protein
MKRIATAIIGVSVVLMIVTGSATTLQLSEVNSSLTSKRLVFTENQGQWDGQVSFRANAGGATLWFTANGAVYQFTRRLPGAREARETRLVRVIPSAVEGRLQPDSIESISIKASFVGANPNPQIIGLEALEYKCNYFFGNDPNEWHTDVSNYNAIVYEEIYTGIDLKYYGNDKQMEYDFIVSPGADPSQIQMRYEGAESISINDNGELVVETKWGEVIEQRPVIYQEANNARTLVDGNYRLVGDNSFGFNLDKNYDPTIPLVIDPVLAYSTFLGSSGMDNLESIVVDDSGNAYVTGYTGPTGFPLVNEYQSSGNGITTFVTKLNASGDDLIYSTYLSGRSDDYVFDIAVDIDGCAYITGCTWSDNYPTVDPYQTYRGTYEWQDVFVTKLSPEGNAIVYSTYLAGTHIDYGQSIAVDSSGQAVITGGTHSGNFPRKRSLQGLNGNWDAFVTKLNSAGNDLVYSTYLGGSGMDYGRGVAADDSGNAYVTGSPSSDFPTTADAYATSGGAFVVKLSDTGSLVYSTRLGSGGASGNDIALDKDANAYITGGGTALTKLNASGNFRFFATSQGAGSGWSIAVDSSGRASITGTTMSNHFPTVEPLQAHRQGDYDAVVTQYGRYGGELLFSTYLGGSNWDEGRGIAVDASGDIYVVGTAPGGGFPILGGFQPDPQGSWDGFVTKFSMDDPTDVEQFDPANLPTHYNMSQCYPNPFNPTTTIEFNLPKRSHVTVKIYNLLGQQVQSLVDQEFSVGNYRVTWDGSTSRGGHASTGVYFYRIVTEDYTETKKMVLLK